MIRLFDDDLWNPGPGMVGAAHYVSAEPPEQDIVERLHAVVEEVTGQPVEQPSRKIGFY